MLKTIETVRLDGEEISPRHEIQILCKACGYDLDEAEISKLQVKLDSLKE